MRVHAEVGVNGKVPRQFVGATESITEIPDIGGLVSYDNVSVDVSVVHLTFQTQRKITLLISDVRLISHEEITHTT